MQILKVNSVLICEDVRFEKQNKVSLVGVFGHLPNANILIRKLNSPIPKLVFFITGTGANGKIKFSAEIIKPNETIGLIMGGDERIFDKPSENQALAFAIGALVPNVEGKYIFKLYANENEFYASHFNIRLGQDKDFA